MPSPHPNTNTHTHTHTHTHATVGFLAVCGVCRLGSGAAARGGGQRWLAHGGRVIKSPHQRAFVTVGMFSFGAHILNTHA